MAERAQNPQLTSTYWDAATERYDAAYADPGRAGYVLRRRLGAVLDLLGDGPGSVLDAGMGPGRAIAELSDRGWTVSGIDASPAMVALARSRLPAAADRLLEASIESIPFDDASFDAVVATGVLEYVQFSPAALRELARVLRPGGVAVLSLPNRHHPLTIWRRCAVDTTLRAAGRMMRSSISARPLRRRPPSRADFQAGLAEAGLAVESQSTIAMAESLEPVRAAHGLLAGQFVFAARRVAPAEAGIVKPSEQMPGRLARIDDPWGITWRLANVGRRASPRLAARFATAYARGVSYERPVFVIASPRSGTSMIFELLKTSRALDGLPFEAHDVWRAFHHPRWSGWDSDAVGAGAVRFGERRFVNAYFHSFLGPCRLVEKTPENSLRVGYLLDLFPDASFVVARRDPCDVINSLINGWRDPAGGFRTYFVPETLRIPGHDHRRMWCFSLIEGWRDYASRPIPEIAFAQWDQCTRAIEDARRLVDPSRWVDLHLESLLERPAESLALICDKLGIENEPALRIKLDELRSTPRNALSAAESAKWRQQNAEEIGLLLPRIAAVAPERGYRVDPASGRTEPLEPVAEAAQGST